MNRMIGYNTNNKIDLPRLFNCEYKINKQTTELNAATVKESTKIYIGHAGWLTRQNIKELPKKSIKQIKLKNK